MAINPTDLSKPGSAHVGSYWAATAGAEVENCDPVTADMDVDVAIIGGGYTGLSTAYHLAREHGVTRPCAGGQSHGLGLQRAQWRLLFGRHRQGRFRRLDAALGSRRGQGDLRAKPRSGAHGEGILDREGIDVDRTPEGALELAHKPNRMAGLAARQAHLSKNFGLDAKLLSKADLERDYLVSREAHGALLHPEGFALHAMKLARGVARAAQRHGAILHGASPVTGWRREGKRHLLTTPGGTVRARQVVIAGNGYTGDRMHPAVDGRLLPVLSNIIVTRELTPAERNAVNWKTHLKIWDSRWLLFYYRLLPQNRVLFGARGGIEDRPDSNQEQRRWLERRFAEMFPPLAKVESEYFWRGWVCL